MFEQRIFRFGFWIFLLVILAGCERKKPILIGFVGELTGSSAIRADLGVAERNGAQLAVDEINKNGGIKGRPIKLIVRDDKGEPDLARQIDAELVAQGVVAIIGHTTSTQTAAVWDQINRDQVVLLSPTTSSSQFDGRVDYLFRMPPSTNLQAQALATHIYVGRGVHQLVGIYDLENRVYAETFWRSFQTRFETLGGTISQSFTFNAGETDLKSLIAEVKTHAPEAVVFIAPSFDTALMIQYARQQGLDAKLFSSAWAATEMFLKKGGQAIEGIEMGMTYYPQNPSPIFQDFVRRFKARYGHQPNFAAAHSYESVLVLAQALEETHGKAEGLPETLVKVKDLEGVQGTISIGEYGDVERDVYIVQVKDGQFEVINTISPDN